MSPHQCVYRSADLVLTACSVITLSDHAYPAHTPFGGYKQSGFGRENHKMALNDYRQVRDGTLPRVCGLSQAQPRAPSETCPMCPSRPSDQEHARLSLQGQARFLLELSPAAECGYIFKPALLRKRSPRRRLAASRVRLCHFHPSDQPQLCCISPPASFKPATPSGPSVTPRVA